MVVNLPDNATRYAHRQIRVALTTDTATVRLTVTDDGPGIPPDRRDEVFERFTRLPSRRAFTWHDQHDQHDPTFHKTNRE